MENHTKFCGAFFYLGGGASPPYLIIHSGDCFMFSAAPSGKNPGDTKAYVYNNIHIPYAVQSKQWLTGQSRVS